MAEKWTRRRHLDQALDIGLAQLHDNAHAKPIGRAAARAHRSVRAQEIVLVGNNVTAGVGAASDALAALPKGSLSRLRLCACSDRCKRTEGRME
jgi:hypothetical protein